MSSKWYIIWTLVGMVTLLVIFGNNPMDELRKKRAERQGKQLVEKIEEANNKKKGIFGGIMGGGGGINSNARTPGTVDWEEEKKAAEAAAAAAADPSRAINNMLPQRGTVYNSSPNPFMKANPYIRPTPNSITQDTGRPGTTPRPQGTSTRNDDGYYPPPPLRKGYNQFGPQSSFEPKPLSPEEIEKLELTKKYERKKNAEHRHPNFVTDDGHPLEYFGTKVYTYAEDGSRIPMPDGQYQMYNGRWIMKIRGGEQVVRNPHSPFWTQY